MKTLILRKTPLREKDIEKVRRFLLMLPLTKRYAVEVKEERNTRSLQQNAFLWGVVYPTFLTEGGLSEQGWTADDIHEYMLGEWSGWTRLEGLGRPRVKPIKRSSTLSTTEFMDFVEFIQRKAAGLSIYIPDPNEFQNADAAPPT